MLPGATEETITQIEKNLTEKKIKTKTKTDAPGRDGGDNNAD